MKDHSRRWLDQPIIVENAPIKISAFVKGRILELRSDGQSRHFVTTGNLFGSQTIACDSLEDAVSAYGIAAEAPEGGQMSLPKGCHLVDQVLQ